MCNDLKNRLSIKQHGFMMSRSTDIRLILSIQIFQWLLIVCVINSCWKSVGIEPASCMWLRAYLSGRIQKKESVAQFLGIPRWHCLLHGKVIWDHFVFIRLVNRISEIFDYVRVLVYARNSLLLNVGKCKTITFGRSRHPVEFSYMLGGTMLDRVSSINDFRFIMDENMTF
jgi:hypothetical protein